MNPCTEEAARAALERLVERPLILIAMPPMAQIEATSESHEGVEEDHDDNCSVHAGGICDCEEPF